MLNLKIRVYIYKGTLCCAYNIFIQNNHMV